MACNFYEKDYLSLGGDLPGSEFMSAFAIPGLAITKNVTPVGWMNYRDEFEEEIPWEPSGEPDNARSKGDMDPDRFRPMLYSD
jgi:hypothetical protein